MRGLLHTCTEAMGSRAEDTDGGAVSTWMAFAVVELDEVTWWRVKTVQNRLGLQATFRGLGKKGNAAKEVEKEGPAR